LVAAAPGRTPVEESYMPAARVPKDSATASRTVVSPSAMKRRSWAMMRARIGGEPSTVRYSGHASLPTMPSARTTSCGAASRGSGGRGVRRRRRV
jgi:hypothetical protein